MKTKFFTLFIALVCATSVFAHDFEVNGIYYNLLGGDSVEVTCRGDHSSGTYPYEHLSSVTLLETVEYNGTTYRVTTIGKTAFKDCSSLTAITIPNSVTIIGWGAFNGCLNLTKVNIPNSVTTIGARAFYDCSSLPRITIPQSVTEIGLWAFIGCSSLQFNTHDNAKYLGNDENPYYALINAVSTSITSCIIHENTKVIAGCAFEGCSSLTAITIPNSVISICDEVFEGCSNLAAITIPNSVPYIGSAICYGCSSLTEPVYTTNFFIFLPTKYSSTYTIPNGIKTILGGAFYGCSSLSAVTIPNSVNLIGESAFDECSSLQEITCLAVKPPKIENDYTFYKVNRSIPLYVPTESVEAYKEAEYWNEFTNIQGVNFPNGVETITSETKDATRKVIENGTIYILRECEAYTTDGRKVK